MRRVGRALLVGGVVFAASSALGQPAPRRFAVVVGNNEGGPGTRPLLYAEEDARRIHRLFLRLGGVKPEDGALLLGQSGAALREVLEKVERQAREAQRAGGRAALLFYYSGHALDGSLRLKNSQVGFAELRERLSRSPMDLRVAVLDACRSGEATRTKGARRAPEFTVEVGASTEAARGLVLLTSSAADEDSQESDLLGGSYFSHHFASGLLGEADRSGDGRVTLSEAYAHAYARTVADTADSAAGAQHPTFSYELHGSGDWVLSDFAERREGLRFPREAPLGTYFVVDARGWVAAEVVRDEAREGRLALPPGEYRLTRRLADRLRLGKAAVRAGEWTLVEEGHWRDAPFSDDPVKGAVRLGLYAPHTSMHLSGTFQAVFDAPASRGGRIPSSGLMGIDVWWHHFFGRGWGLGLDALIGGSSGTLNAEGLRLPYRYSQVSLGASLLAEWPGETLRPFAGARLGWSLLNRSFPNTTLPTQGLATLAPGAVGGITWHFSPRFNLTARARLHYLLYTVDGVRNFGYLEAAALVGYDFDRGAP